MKKTKHYINLTNGLELLPSLQDYRFIRIQSTHLERGNFNDVLFQLPPEFLMDLALGNMVIVYDCSCRVREPRSIWQGLEWIKFVLNRLWFNRDYEPKGRASSSFKYFHEQYKKIPKKIRNHLKYYRKFLNTKELDLYSSCCVTSHDNNYEYFRELLIHKNKIS